MKVLSLFDGMSCGQIALKELGHDVIYYASEIDKHAIGQTQLNFPRTVQLGDVTKWREWDLDWSAIDLVLAGSPCQGFSFAGKQLAFDDPRSKLFFVFVEILNHIKKLNPDVKFLLENVNMKKEYLRVISEYVGVFPVNINSNLVSAQNRDRWYWTNIRTKKVGLFDEVYTDIPQPKDRGILLKNILEPEVNEKYFLSDKMLRYLTEEKNRVPNNLDKKASCFTAGAHSAGAHSQMDLICVAMRGRNPENPSDRTTGSPTEQRLEPKTDGKTNYLTSVAKDNLIMQINPSLESGGKQPYQHNRVYDTEGIAPCLNTDARSPGVLTQSRIRRLTPAECARIQTIPDWYKWEFVELYYFGYICSATKNTIVCKSNVMLKGVTDQSQISQQDFVTCTTLDLLELEKQRLEKLTNQKNVKLMDAIEMHKQCNTETYVSCITKDFIDTENLQNKLNKAKRPVNIVIEKLAEGVRTECVPVIIEVGNCLEIHLMLKPGKKKVNHLLKKEDITELRIKNTDTNMSWRVLLAENSKEEKLYTMLALTNWIIARRIYIYAKDSLNIHLFIDNLNVSEQNYTKLELSDLRMESILSTSDTQIYRMCGNGWTVEVIKHILSFL